MQRADESDQLRRKPIHLNQVLHTLPLTPPHPCAYIEGQSARDRGFALARLDSETWEYLLESGWRRAGGMIYEPNCPYCHECTPLRIPVGRFAPNRIQRRTIKLNHDLTAEIVPAYVDEERADLYRRYIRSRHDGLMSGSRREMENFLGMSPVDTFEIEFRQNTQGHPKSSTTTEGLLKAVMVVDRTPNAWNAVYCYFDPDDKKRSLGTFAITQAVTLCRHHCSAGDDAHLYLGYWVPGSKTMGYKARFHPHEIRGRDGRWQPVT